jgi:S1-C subfamily serine protease
MTRALLFLLLFAASPASALDDGIESLRQTGKAFASVARTVSPSVAFVQIERSEPQSAITRFSSPFGNEFPFGDDLFERFFGDRFQGIPQMPEREMPRGERRALGQGSGFVFAAKDGLISDKTYLLTNNHVIENAKKIRVKFQDGREFEADVTGRDPQSDVAVIEIAAIANQLIEHGEVTRGFLGVVIQQITPDLAESFAIDAGKGILVAQVSENSPAEKAGLRQGDVILIFRGKPVTNIGSFRNQVSLTAPGTTAQLTVLRDGKRKNLKVTIGKLTDDNLIAQGPAQSTEEMGLSVQTLTPQLAGKFDARPGEGVVVTEVRPGSIAAQVGIEPGCIILQVNRKAVKSAAKFSAAVKESRRNKRLLLLIRKDGIQRFVALSW